MIRTIKKRFSKKSVAILTAFVMPVLAVSYQQNLFSHNRSENVFLFHQIFASQEVMAAALGDIKSTNNLDNNSEQNSIDTKNQTNADKSIGIENLTLVSYPQNEKEANQVAAEKTEIVSHTYDLIRSITHAKSDDTSGTMSNRGIDDGSERVQVSYQPTFSEPILKPSDPNAIETKLVNWFFAPKALPIDSDVKKEFSATSLKFSYLNLNHIEEHAPQAFNNYDLANTYAQQKKIAAMQKTALYISQNYELDLNKSEKIVLEVYKHSNLQNLPPSLLLGVIDAESTFQEQAVSSRAAQGLMQVIPKYHPEEMQAISSRKVGIASIEGGIEVGAKVLRKYLNSARGNLSLALQMYNGSTSDPTKRYSTKVLSKTGRFEVVAKK